MFLLDDILMLPMKLPIAGFNWIMKQIQTMANEELLNDQPWKERLIELQMMLEVGDITEEDYARQEAQVFQALRDIRARREQMAREPPPRAAMMTRAASASTPDTGSDARRGVRLDRRPARRDPVRRQRRRRQDDDLDRCRAAPFEVAASDPLHDRSRLESF